MRKFTLLELCQLREACDDPYMCPIAELCPRAAQIQRNMRGRILSSLDGRVIAVNRGAEAVLGLPEAEIRRLGTPAFHIPGQRERVIRELRQRGSIKDVSVVLIHSTGSLLEAVASGGFTVYHGEGTLEFEAQLVARRWIVQSVVPGVRVIGGRG